MKLAIVGHFGGDKVFNDGQTIKTVTLHNALSKYDICEIKKVDTYYIKKNPVKFVFDFLQATVFCKKTIILLSKNGRRVLFPVYYFLSIFWGTEVYHYAIGGRLAKEITKNPSYKKYVLSFKENWVESSILEDMLKDLGVCNAEFLPNFKSLKNLSEENLCYNEEEPYKFCTFSRVTYEKGISDAILAVTEINNAAGKVVAELDIYGPISENYKLKFDGDLSNSIGCKYCGVINANDSVDVIKKYFCLLFPTHWYHEGIPGTIIDALASGVPVISRRWRYCDEMLKDSSTGYIYDFNKPWMLKEKIMYAIKNVEETNSMKHNCLAASKQYSEENVIKKIIYKIKK